MGFIDWFFGGLNFEETTHGKVGDIIYPAYNGTNGFCKKERWDLVMKVDKKGFIICVAFIWDFATIRAIELIQELNKKKEK